MHFYGWTLCFVGLQKKDFLKLRKVIDWNYLYTLTFREGVPFALYGEVLFQTNAQAIQKMGKEQEKKENKVGRGGLLWERE